MTRPSIGALFHLLSTSPLSTPAVARAQSTIAGVVRDTTLGRPLLTLQGRMMRLGAQLRF